MYKDVTNINGFRKILTGEQKEYKGKRRIKVGDAFKVIRNTENDKRKQMQTQKGIVAGVYNNFVVRQFKTKSGVDLKEGFTWDEIEKMEKWKNGRERK